MITRFFPPVKQENWQDYFDTDEELLWQGAPEPGAQSLPRTLFMSIFGLPFLAAGLWMAFDGFDSKLPFDGFVHVFFGVLMVLFAIPFIVVGASITFGVWLYAKHSHHYIRYALTNKRAYVAKSFYRHTLQIYQIMPDDAITLEQGRYDNVKFKTIYTKDSDGETRRDIGFDGISGGREVYGLIGQIQREGPA
ncbi:hypothetical protein [Cognatiyoonia sp. IB215182]|uniref:hypothetical protein n=1 Tax=Cognatiyoonia sp. IB215182 TaxID=3097353 RepID=UPI002A18144C|nr:hypothetical protein [Cognatiyoonia sp. IB215182]MDX8354250.1 hypothetical protein [Cognatiyoonia sp. IB215182]